MQLKRFRINREQSLRGWKTMHVRVTACWRGAPIGRAMMGGEKLEPRAHADVRTLEQGGYDKDWLVLADLSTRTACATNPRCRLSLRIPVGRPGTHRSRARLDHLVDPRQDFVDEV